MFRERPQAFLSLPWKGPASPELAAQIAAALEQHGFEAVLPEGLAPTGPSPDRIQGAIRNSQVVVADVTGKNPNVLFEVGVALGLGKPVLLLSQQPLEDVPFDLRALQIAVYRPDDLATVRRYVEMWLRDTIAQQTLASY